MTIAELLGDARRRGAAATPDVRAAALLRIARVEVTFDSEQARRTFNEAVALAWELAERDRGLMMDHARTFAAVIAPEKLSDLPSLGRMRHHLRESDELGRLMLAHGRDEAALRLLLGSPKNMRFPFELAQGLLGRLQDSDSKQQVLRCATQAMQVVYGATGMDFHSKSRFYRSYWRDMPREEAVTILRSVVAAIESSPEFPMLASFQLQPLREHAEFRIESSRAFHLFELAAELRELDPGSGASGDEDKRTPEAG